MHIHIHTHTHIRIHTLCILTYLLTHSLYCYCRVAAFDLFDLDGDGFIDFSEMVRYLTSFFEVCFDLEENMKKRFGNCMYVCYVWYVMYIMYACTRIMFCR